MSKAKIIDKKSVDSILGEKNLLSELHHPFIVNMIYSFQDHEYLYLVMDLLPGGNLRYHITLKNTFNEKQIKFLIGCIMIGLKYIHGQNILHRDIKPENLVFDNNGYLRITDFGIAKHYVINNKKDTSGTVGYLAPEVLCNVNHNFCIDYYAVGIITYELMYGHRPYLGKSKHEVKQLILTKQAEIDYDELPEGFSNETADFINRLIQRKPKNRLGRNSINEVLTHPWFDGFDWENTRKKKLKAPYIPKIGDNFDKKYCLQSNKIGTETMDRYKNIMMEDDYELIFKDFNCNKIPEELIGYSKKQINNYLKEVNNHLPNNISISFSRNNRNENKQNNYLVHPEINKDYANIINKNLIQKKNKIYKNDNEYTDFDSSIFKQIASLNKSLNNIALNKSNKNINININNLNINKTKNNINNNKQNINNGSFLNKRRNINLFRNNNNYKNMSKTYRNDYIIKKNFINANINNNYLDVTDTTNERNYSKNQKNNDEKINKKNIMFNNNNLFRDYTNKKHEHLNRNISMGDLRKSKNIINDSTTIDKSSLISFNSGILKNMKYQYQDLYNNKRNKFLNYRKNNSKIKKDSNINNASQYNNNHKSNFNYNFNKSIYYNEMNNNSVFQSNNNSLLKRNSSMSIPKSKKDFMRKEILKGSTTYFNYNLNNQNQRQNNPNINMNKHKKQQTSILMSSTIYSKKKPNSSQGSIINSKRLASSRSMYNLKSNSNIIRERGIPNYNLFSKQKSNVIKLDRNSKNNSIINRNIPFMNFALTKKKGTALDNDIYYASSGKMINVSDKKYKEKNFNLDYVFFTDRIRNKNMRNHDIKVNYINKSGNNIFYN